MTYEALARKQPFHPTMEVPERRGGERSGSPPLRGGASMVDRRPDGGQAAPDPEAPSPGTWAPSCGVMASTTPTSALGAGSARKGPWYA